MEENKPNEAKERNNDSSDNCRVRTGPGIPGISWKKIVSWNSAENSWKLILPPGKVLELAENV
jgi:hypothetical protein